MKVSTTLLGLALAASVDAHTIFQVRKKDIIDEKFTKTPMQKVSVNGVDQGQLKGVRAPSSDYVCGSLRLRANKISTRVCSPSRMLTMQTLPATKTYNSKTTTSLIYPLERALELGGVMSSEVRKGQMTLTIPLQEATKVSRSTETRTVEEMIRDIEPQDQPWCILPRLITQRLPTLEA